MEHFVRLVNAVAEADKGHGHESEARYELAEHTLERFSLAAQQNCERRKYRRYDGENWDEHKQISFLFGRVAAEFTFALLFSPFPNIPLRYVRFGCRRTRSIPCPLWRPADTAAASSGCGMNADRDRTVPCSGYPRRRSGHSVIASERDPCGLLHIGHRGVYPVIGGI